MQGRAVKKTRVRASSSAAPSSKGKAGAPSFVPPCLATLAAAPPDGEAWVHEIKYDGYRIQARIADGMVQLLTRTGLDWTNRFSSIAKAMQSLKAASAVIDGEVVVERADGVTSFTDLVAALEDGRSEAMSYIAFDLLFLDGADVRDAALSERKALLELLLKTSRSKRLRYSEHFRTDGGALLAEACRLGLEGLISKRSDLPYRSGRRSDWLKSKCIAADEFVIGGYAVSTADSKAIGALALGAYDRGRLIYAGRVGTGFSHALARELYSSLKPLKQDAPPFSTRLTALQKRGIVWVAPRLVGQIEYRSVTGDGLLRHASFQGLRKDKPAPSVALPSALRRS
jgi:bifunctional non-homologous end joining protein LigD